MTRPLPIFDFASESSDDVRVMTDCLREQCADFAKGSCSLHRPLACFCYHQPKQRRRPVFDGFGRIRYWDQLCNSMDVHGNCPNGDGCEFAHSKIEIAFHPARFRIKICNGIECRGVVCCFAHSLESVRTRAPSQYGFYAHSTKASSGGAPKRAETQREPNPFSMHRFCESFPEFSNCNQGDSCFFAHSFEELGEELLNCDGANFYPLHFKTCWCPFSHQHDWSMCDYAHNWQDCRRPPQLGYGPAPCPYWDKSDARAEYAQRCPNGLRCAFAHGRKEQLYHPVFYKTQDCCDWRKHLADGVCPRGSVCAFAHGDAERRPELLVLFDYHTLLDESVVGEACSHLRNKPVLIPVMRIPKIETEIENCGDTHNLSSPHGEDLNMQEYLRFVFESS